MDPKSSAHDLGAIWAGGTVNCTASEASLAFTLEAISSAFAKLSALDGDIDLGAPEAVLAEVLLAGRAAIGRFGTAGIMGRIVLGRPEPFALGVVCCCGAVDEGVVGCVEKSSDGGCDVVGVSRPSDAGNASSTRNGSSLGVVVSPTSVSLSVMDPRRRGSSTDVSCGAGLLFRRDFQGTKPP